MEIIRPEGKLRPEKGQGSQNGDGHAPLHRGAVKSQHSDAEKELRTVPCTLQAPNGCRLPSLSSLSLLAAGSNQVQSQ